MCRCSTLPRHVCVVLVAVPLCHATYVSLLLLFHSAMSRLFALSLLRPLHCPVAFVCVGLPTVLYLLTVKCGELNNFCSGHGGKVRGPVKERLGAQVHETEGNGEVRSLHLTNDKCSKLYTWRSAEMGGCEPLEPVASAGY